MRVFEGVNISEMSDIDIVNSVVAVYNGSW